MYANIKLVEEFETSLKNLLTEGAEASSFDFDDKKDHMKQAHNFNIEDEVDEDDDELLEESFMLEESANKTRDMKKIISELEEELDEDEDEDFDGDGEDDINPDELNELHLGADDEIKELSDEEEDDKIDEAIVLEDLNLDIDDQLLIENMTLDIDEEDYISEDVDFIEGLSLEEDAIMEDVDFIEGLSLEEDADYISEDVDYLYDLDLDLDM